MKKKILAMLIVLAVFVTAFATFYVVNNLSTPTYAYDVNPSECTHPQLYRSKITFEADCQHYAHIDIICDLCGTVISTERIGSQFGSCKYDYESIVRYVDGSGSKCVPYKTGGFTAVFRCKVCGNTVTSKEKDLAYHTNVDTSRKLWSDEEEMYYYNCRGCNQHVKCLIQISGSYGDKDKSDNPIYTTDDPYVTTEDDRPVHVHSYTTKTVDATCTTEGYTAMICSICGDRVTISTTGALGHQYGNYVTETEPTCSNVGRKVASCIRCGVKVYETIPATGHQYGTSPVSTNPSTCSSRGSETFACIYCGQKDVRYTDIDPTKHSFSEEWRVISEGTCKVPSLIAATCNLCGQTITKESSLGNHIYREETTIAPTCQHTGILKFTCTECGDTYSEVLDKTGHNFGFPSSDGKGTVTYICSDCGMTVMSSITKNKMTKTIISGPCKLTISDEVLAYKDGSAFNFVVKKVDKSSEEFNKHKTYLNVLNASTSTVYSVQEVYEITLYVDGQEVQLTPDMTLTIGLDSELGDSKTKIVYYSSENGQTMIINMEKASRKKLTVTIPGSELIKSANNQFILAIQGNAIQTSGDGRVDAVPAQAETNNTVLIILIVVGVVVLIGVAVVVIAGRKKSSF